MYSWANIYQGLPQVMYDYLDGEPRYCYGCMRLFGLHSHHVKKIQWTAVVFIMMII